jgi:hypothetical protein
MFRIYSNLMRPVKASTIIDVTSAEIGTKELRTSSIFTNYFIKTFIFIINAFTNNGLIVFHKDIQDIISNIQLILNTYFISN